MPSHDPNAALFWLLASLALLCNSAHADVQEFDLAGRQQAPERQLAALAELRKAPGPGAANLLRAARTCEGAAGLRCIGTSEQS